MKQMPAPTDDLRERFILFLASKPADQRYDWNSSRHCACGTFIRECVGEPVQVRRWYAPWSTKTVMQRHRFQENQVWSRWNTMAFSCHTYGELLQSVRSYETWRIPRRFTG